MRQAFGRAGLFAASVMGCLVWSQTAVSADDTPIKTPAPAVDGVNVKADAFGGSAAGNGLYGARGSLTIPLASRYGLQLDAAGGGFGSRFFAGAQGHLFWRYPGSALVGLVVQHTYWDKAGGLNASQAGLEAALYRGAWTLSGTAGVEWGTSRSVVVNGFTDRYDIATRFFDRVDLSYYLTDNFKLSLGHRYTGGKHALALGGGFGIATGGGTMASLFAEGRVGEAGSGQSLLGGVRVYFGQKAKPLIARQRQDDPDGIDVNGSLSTFTNAAVTGLMTQEACESRDHNFWVWDPATSSCLYIN